MFDTLGHHDPEQLRAAALAAWQRAEALERQARELEARNRALTDANERLATEKRELAAKNEALETELSVLLRRIAVLTKKLAEATDRDVQLELDLELRRLREQLAMHVKERFGSSRSEKRGRPETEQAEPKKDKKPKKGHGPTAQRQLFREEVVHHLDDADCCCPKCGDDLAVMAEQFEESELIAAVKVRYVLQHHKAQKYRCRGCGHIDTALGPLRLIPGGRYDLSFAVQVALGKYCDHLPLERQVERMARKGLTVTSQTLWDQLFALYMVLLPTLVAQQAKVLSADLVHADETTWRVMGKGRSAKWWIWTVVSEHGVYVDILPTRGAEAARHVLAGYAGIVMADGYGVYASLEHALDRQGGAQLDVDGATEVLPNFLLAACWAHARRPLLQAEPSVPEVAHALDLIAKLYAIEAEAESLAERDDHALLEHRRRLRDERSRAVIRELEIWRRAQRALPGTKHHKAVTYLKNQWTRLTRFLDEPRIPLDNNPAERAIRKPVLGRKNHLGSRSESGVRVAGLFYSLLGTCRHLGLDPEAWLEEAATRALRDPGTVLLPCDYAAELRAAQIVDA